MRIQEILCEYDTKGQAFRNWFGNSKVVDTDGNPLVVYHGTVHDFAKFDPKKRGGFGGAIGHWFASDPTAIKPFQQVRVPTQDTPLSMPVYLSLRSPKVYNSYDAFIKEGDERKGREIEHRLRSLRNSLIRSGYDGIIIRNSVTDSGVLRDDFVAFNPNQIKSVYNRGTYDPNSPNISEQFE